MKEIIIVIPAIEKNGISQLVTVPISSEAGLYTFNNLNKGFFIDSNNRKVTFEDMRSGNVYTSISCSVPPLLQAVVRTMPRRFKSVNSDNLLYRRGKRNQSPWLASRDRCH